MNNNRRDYISEEKKILENEYLKQLFKNIQTDIANSTLAHIDKEIGLRFTSLFRLEIMLGLDKAYNDGQEDNELHN